MERVEAEAIYGQGREAVVEVLLALSAQNERLASQVEVLTARVARQDERIAQLERRLNRSSRNSSSPPSVDPPNKKPKRGKDPSGRSQGAQTGHEGHGRELLPLSAVDEVIEHWPERCECGHAFAAGELLAVGEPLRHQVEELPVISAQVIEHRAQRVCCPGCGAHTRAEIPSDIAASAFGPRFQAAVAALSVRNRVSRRDVVELCEELFGARVCAGTVDAILTRISDALDDPYEDLLGRVRCSESLNMDETGWRLKGTQRALWGMFTARHAVFAVAAGRHEEHAKRLLEGHTGIVTSDRWWAYNHLPLSRRQLCWSHLQRDFQAHAEGLARTLDVRQPPRRDTDQQPRRALATQRRHLPQALPGQPIRERRATHRAPPLRAHHLPTTTPLPVRLPHRHAHSPRPRRPSSHTHLTPRDADGLNAYENPPICSDFAMARPRLELGTPRFSVVCSTN